LLYACVLSLLMTEVFRLCPMRTAGQQSLSAFQNALTEKIRIISKDYD